MQKRLTVQNCTDMYSFAKCLCCTELQSEAFSMICRRFADICQRESFFKLSKEDIIDFLSSDDLSVSYLNIATYENGTEIFTPVKIKKTY